MPDPVKAKATKLATKLGGQDAHEGDAVLWRGATWTLVGDGQPIGERPAVRLKGYKSSVLASEVRLAPVDPKPAKAAAKAEPEASARATRTTEPVK